MSQAESATGEAITHPPSDAPLPAIARLVRWLLCIAIMATVIASAIRTFRGDGTAINAFLFLDLGWSHAQAVQAERLAMTAILVLTLLGVIRPHWLLLTPAGLYLLAEACLTAHVGGQAFSEWAPAAAALRFTTPLVTPFVLAFCWSRRTTSDASANSKTATGAAWLLRLALGVVFITHGYEALRHHPVFIDLVIGTGARMFDIWLQESLVTKILTVIGTVDIVVGIAIVLSSNRAVLGWAAFWGLITALSRMTAYGWGAYPDLLMRATHFLVPLVLLILASRRLVNERQDGVDSTRSNDSESGH